MQKNYELFTTTSELFKLVRGELNKCDYICQGGYVMPDICLSVCLSVNNFM